MGKGTPWNPGPSVTTMSACMSLGKWLLISVSLLFFKMTEMLFYCINLLATNNCQGLTFLLSHLQSRQMRETKTGPSAWQTNTFPPYRPAGWQRSGLGKGRHAMPQGHSCTQMSLWLTPPPHQKQVADEWIKHHCDVPDRGSPCLLSVSLAKIGVRPLYS